MEVGFVVKVRDAVIDPLTVMIHTIDTNIAPPAVVVSGGLDALTDWALLDGLRFLKEFCLTFLSYFGKG
jgi:hypothetical protein